MAGDTVIRRGKATIKIEGMTALFRRLNKLGDNAADAAVDAFSSGGKRLFARSQDLVPVDTGALKASGRFSKPRVNKRTGVVTASVVYGGQKLARLAPGDSPLYAIAVHEDPTGRGFKFLERPALAARAEVERELSSRIAKRVEGR